MIYSPGLMHANKEESIIDKISNFVEGIRIDSRKGRSHDKARSELRRDEHDQDSFTPQRRIVRSRSRSRSPGYRRKDKGTTATVSTSVQQGRNNEEDYDPGQVADQLLVQVEKFKAKIEAPKGNNFHDLLMPYDYEKLKSRFVKPEGLAPLDKEILFLRNFDQDNEFFHVTSQIEPSLRVKIERGEFVELERLLPKERGFGTRSGSDDLNRQIYQLITQGTNNYLEPPLSRATGKINSIRKWDQAFRVYAAIYTNANPERASEIWQYVYMIHTAATSNPWDDVYYYDINFHKLMASKPWRSWGKTYTQGWNMAFNNSTVGHQGGQSSSNSNSSSSKFSSGKSWKDECCWRYNKNRCQKSGSDCNYDHRCTYCAGWNHGFYNCRKRQNKNKRSSFQGKTTSPKRGSPRGDKK